MNHVQNQNCHFASSNNEKDKQTGDEHEPLKKSKIVRFDYACSVYTWHKIQGESE